MARTSVQTRRFPWPAEVVLKMPTNGEARNEPTEKVRAANPTLTAPVAWNTKFSARKASTTTASSPIVLAATDRTDHLCVDLLRVSAPVTGLAVEGGLVTPRGY